MNEKNVGKDLKISGISFSVKEQMFYIFYIKQYFLHKTFSLDAPEFGPRVTFHSYMYGIWSSIKYSHLKIFFYSVILTVNFY